MKKIAIRTIRSMRAARGTGDMRWRASCCLTGLETKRLSSWSNKIHLGSFSAMMSGIFIYDAGGRISFLQYKLFASVEA
ncbi:MAG: hypothetical protein ACE5I5_08740 [Candidatus Heimdallarchaeota archaeon]